MSDPRVNFTVTVTNGFRVPLLPPAEEARRIVRWGLRDVLMWLGENPGPMPGDPWSTVWS